MKKKIVSLFVALGVAFTVMFGSTAAAVATAEPAEAYTITDCRIDDGGRYFQSSVECYYDYNWWETWVLGERDGWEHAYWIY